MSESLLKSKKAVDVNTEVQEVLCLTCDADVLLLGEMERPRSPNIQEESCYFVGWGGIVHI